MHMRMRGECEGNWRARRDMRLRRGRVRVTAKSTHASATHALTHLGVAVGSRPPQPLVTSYAEPSCVGEMGGARL